MNVSEAQKEVNHWIKTHGVRYFDILTNMAQLIEEVGEVARIIARRYGEQSEKESDKQKNLSEELCDVFFVVCCIANDQKIELEKYFQKKMHLAKENPQKEDVFITLIKISIAVGQIAKVISAKNVNKDSKTTENLEKEKEILAENLSDVLLALLSMAEKTTSNLFENFLKRLEEKAKRDHNRNWTNKKLLS